MRFPKKGTPWVSAAFGTKNMGRAEFPARLPTVRLTLIS
jgi:hypothetical protein